MDAAADAAAEARPRTAADDERVRLIRDNFRRLRGHVILGTDAGAVGDFFGCADHLELELFVRLGMTPAEAIVAATTRAPRAFGLIHTAAIEAGRVADLLVLDANPLADIRHTRQIAAVYLRGVEIDRAALRAGVDGLIEGLRCRESRRAPGTALPAPWSSWRRRSTSSRRPMSGSRAW